jgi:hypothetical protein
MDKRQRKEGKISVIILVLCMLLNIFFIPGVFSDEVYDVTAVSVSIPSLVYGVGDTFIVTISCTPGQSIKAYECSLTYDPSVVTVQSVSEGDIFSGFDTFYNGGTIDNTAGELNDVYSVIVGPGTVTDAGSLMTVSFEAVGTGTAWINLTDVGVTNETSYVTINLTNDSCEIDGDSPSITDISRTSSDPLDTSSSYGWVNISCTATDDTGIDMVILEVLCPNSTTIYRTCAHGSDDTWYYNTSDVFITAGNFSYILNASDYTGNSQTSSSVVFLMPANWDIDMNGICNVFDFTLVANIYENTGAAGWSREDVDNNGEISLLDLVSLSNHYGDSWYT